MKAEHRKELHTNALAAKLASIWQGLRSGKKSTTIAIWGAVLLVIATFVVYRYIRASSFADRSAQWTRLNDATSTADLKALEEIAQNDRGTPSQMARFQMARLLLHQGLQNLGSPARRAESADNIEKARALYEELALEAAESPPLVQEALMGAAKAEESLIGIPKKDDPALMRGTVEKAIEYYERLAKTPPESFQTRAAARRAELLRKDSEQIQKFYVELNQSLTRPNP